MHADPQTRRINVGGKACPNNLNLVLDLEENYKNLQPLVWRTNAYHSHLVSAVGQHSWIQTTVGFGGCKRYSRTRWQGKPPPTPICTRISNTLPIPARLPLPLSPHPTHQVAAWVPRVGSSWRRYSSLPPAAPSPLHRTKRRYWRWQPGVNGWAKERKVGGREAGK